MKKTFIAIAAAAVLVPASGAWAAPKLSHADREEVIHAFVISKWVANTAEKYCDKMIFDLVTMVAADHVLDLTEAERMRGEKYLMSVVHNLVVASMPRPEWCTSAYHMYGPHGSIIPNLIRDKE